MKFKFWYKGDLDGFFGLFIDNLLQLMLIQVLCKVVCGMPDELIYGKILPGAAVSILLGNAYYTWQAYQLMKKEGRDTVTALPYGINTISLFAYIFFIMAPVYWSTQDADLAWKLGLLACFVGGIMECLGAFFGDIIRKYTPRAAMLSALGGVAITFISMGFIFQIFSSPLIAIIPMVFIITCYASGLKLPFSMPSGLVAVLLGIVLAWSFKSAGLVNFTVPQESWSLNVYLPALTINELLDIMNHPKAWTFMAVIFPMGLFNIVGSLQNLESAAASGDNFNSKPSLIANGLGSLVAACFGSPFPTTIYIGHPAWKEMGARASYSLVNGIVTCLLCFVGAVTLILKVMPLEVSLGILLWIGIIMMAQCFQSTPKQHALGVVVGLIPSIASWALIIIEMCLRIGGTSLYKAFPLFANENFFIHGLVSLNQGFLLTSIGFAAFMVKVIDKKFHHAALWLMLLSIMSFFGLIHAYTLNESGLHYKLGLFAAPKFATAYFLCALLMLFFASIQKSKEIENEDM